MTAEITASLIKELRDRTGVGMGKCKEALVKSQGDMEHAIEILRKEGMAAAVKKEGRSTKEGMIGFAENQSSIAIVEVNAETDFVVNNDLFQKFVRDLTEEILATQPASLDAFLNQQFSKEPSLTIEAYRASLVQTIGENIQIRRLKIFPKLSDAAIGLYSHLGGKIVTIVELKGNSDEIELSKDIAMHVAAAAPEYLSKENVPQEIVEKEKEIARSQISGKPENIIEKILEGKMKSFYDSVCLLHQKFIKDEKITVEQLIENQSKASGKPLILSIFERWVVGQ